MSAPLVSERTSEESTVLRQKAAPIEPAKGPPAETVPNAADEDNLLKVLPPQPAGRWKPPPARWIALIFCLGAAVTLCSVWMAQHLGKPAAEVILSVPSQTGTKPTRTVTVNGNVLYRGQPVGGTALITIRDLADGRFMESQVATVRKDGAFGTQLTGNWNEYEPLEIRADYRGKANSQLLAGTATCYLNGAAPPSIWQWVAAALAFFLLFLLIVLFTGPLSPMKARVLFIVTYALTFIAVLIPLLTMAFISGNWYLKSRMENSPVGILRATTPNEKTEPQWYLNLGGSADNNSNSPYPVLHGGAPVPLYVLILALFGAAINAMRRLPKIQKDHDSTCGMTLVGAPITIFRAIFAPRAGPVAAVDDGAEIKRLLIETYMYFLSAPVLVIAIYYLLQAMNAVAQPTLVVMAFATGLMTNTATEAIIAFADAIFYSVRKKRREAEEKAEPPRIAESAATASR